MGWTTTEASGTWPHPWGDLKPLGLFEWTKVIRRTKLPTATKAVALILGSYADTKTGYKVRPGQARIAREACMTDRSVRTHLRELERLGLIYCTERGSNMGTAGAASHYVLTALVDLIEEVEATPDTRIIDLETPDHRKPASAATVDNSEDHRKPASAGSDEPPEIYDTTTGKMEQTTGKMKQDHRKPASTYLHKTSPSESLQTISSWRENSAWDSPAAPEREVLAGEIVEENGWAQSVPGFLWGSSPKPARDDRQMCQECMKMHPPTAIARVEGIGRVCESCRAANKWEAA
jgi:hypothetical protein